MNHDLMPARRLRSVTNESLAAVIRMPIADLVPGRTPRLEGESEEHVRALADTDATLPPIIVQHPSMRIIDGMHRLRAARMRGDATIAVRFLHCDEAEAFVRSVQENIAHGLPLSQADRLAAAERIVGLYPQWSDRALAAASGVTPRTVALIRLRGRTRTADRTRIGRDGRVRPTNAVEGRRRASEYLAKHPDASLREIARAAGISPTTARHVRNALSASDGPDPQPERNTPRGTARSDRPARMSADRADLRQLVTNLRRDPSLRYSERGRTLLRWLELHVVSAEEWETLMGSVPPHCSFTIAALARSCAAAWKDLATRMEQQQRDDADQHAAG